MEFIPLKNFLPPLLHILIGIWNDIWDKFRELVSECIGYIACDEADLRAKKEPIIKKGMTFVRRAMNGRWPSQAKN